MLKTPLALSLPSLYHLYKNEGLKALSDSEYFDNAIETVDCDLDVVEHAENIEINDERRYGKDVFPEDITEARTVQHYRALIFYESM